MEFFRRNWPRNMWLQVGATILLSLLTLALVSFLFGDFCGQEKEGCYGDYASNNIAYVAVARFVEVAEAHNALITAIATALLTYVTVLLFRIEKEGAKATKAQLRAYISPFPKRMGLRSDDKTMIVLVDLENVGQTPAFHVQALGKTVVREGPPYRFNIGVMDERDFGKAVPTFTIYPTGKHHSIIIHKLTDDEIKQVESGKFAVYVFGRVTYLDAFKEPQWAEFCAYLEEPYFTDALRLAKESPDRRQVPVGFKFAAFGNESSFQ